MRSKKSLEDILYDNQSNKSEIEKLEESDAISLRTDRLPGLHEFDEEWPLVISGMDSNENMDRFKTEKHSRNMIDRKTLSRNMEIRAGFSDGCFPTSER